MDFAAAYNQSRHAQVLMSQLSNLVISQGIQESNPNFYLSEPFALPRTFPSDVPNDFTGLVILAIVILVPSILVVIQKKRLK